MSASAPSSTGTKISNSERKDRSIRLWGERGQLALEQVSSATPLPAAHVECDVRD